MYAVEEITSILYITIMKKIHTKKVKFEWEKCGKLEKFNGKDFGFWEMLIEDYFYQKKTLSTWERQS